MVGAGTAGASRRLAESCVAISSASEGVFLYYKFGRYEGVFSEKPYFLLSHCAHVLFSLWRFEEEEGGPVFLGRPRPTAFLNGLDFGSLRYNDYKRRMLHADSFEEHWRNETQWFEFWIQVLEHWDPSGTAVRQEFSRCILACVTQRDVLERKAMRRTHTAFDRFMKTDATGSVMLRTLSVLDEVMQGIVQGLAGLAPSTSVLERITVVGALLNEIRRMVVYQTPAKGPYTPLGATRWRAPSPLGRMFWGRTQGVLTVVPRREGGDIICTYDPVSQPKNRRRSWTRPVSSLPGTYEQELFATWPHGTGECPDDPGHPSDVTAHWTLQNEEAGRLETICKRIDALLDGLGGNPTCERLIEEIRSVSRNGHAKWKAVDIPWTYICRLDELLGRLRSICRGANVPGGNDKAEKIVTRVCPAPQAEAGEADSQSRREQDSSVQTKPADEKQAVIREEQVARSDEVQPVAEDSSPVICGKSMSLDPSPQIEPVGIDPPAVVEPRQTAAQDEPVAGPTPASSPGQMPGKADSMGDLSAPAWCTARLPTARSLRRCAMPRKPRRTRPAAQTPEPTDCPAQPCFCDEPVAQKEPRRRARRRPIQANSPQNQAEC